MVEGRPDPFQDEGDLQDAEQGALPGVDLQLGDEVEISGGDDLADQDEENLYGNDVIISDEEDEIEDEPGPANLAPPDDDEES